MTGLCLGIDIGTSGIRTAVLDDQSDVISTARTQHEAQDTERIDAEAWWRAVQDCISAQSKALEQFGRNPSEITNIGVDGTSGTMVLTDAALTPVTRALMYNSTGFEDEAAIIARHAPDTHITKGAGSALARALRLQSEDTAARAKHLLHQADFIIAKLLGHGGHSDHNNTLKLGFDPALESWPDWIDLTGLRPDLLPKVSAAGTALGPIDQAIASTLGFSKTTTIHAGTTDSIAAFLAAAPLEQGAAVTSLGTTLAIKILSPVRIDAPEVGLYSHRLGDLWLAGGASNTGGGVLAALFTTDELIQLSGMIDPSRPSPHDYYPLLTPGERFPFNDPHYQPKMTPRPDNDAEFLHGLLEGIAQIEAACYAAIATHGGPRPTQLFTAGGGAANAIWTQIRARILGIVPQKAAHSEAAIGAARLAQGV